MWRKEDTFALLVGMQIGAATVESSLELPQKIKNGTVLILSDSTSGNLPKETQNTNLKEYMHLYIAALFTIAKILKQPKCPSVDGRIKKLWYICTMEYYLAAKKEEVLPFATAWMDLGSIVLSEISQLEKDKYHRISFTCGIQLTK